MRYFLLTIYIQNTSETYQRSNITMTVYGFPSIKDITEFVKNENMIIENIFEFKSKEDYDSFTSKP